MNRRVLLGTIAGLAWVAFLAFAPGAMAQRTSAPARIGGMAPVFEGDSLDASLLMLEQLKPYVYRGKVAQEEGFYVADRFARCAVGLNLDRARNLLDAAMTPEGHNLSDEQRYYTRLRGCAVKRIYIDRDFMRGALAAHIIAARPEVADTVPVQSQDELIDYLQAIEVAERSTTNLLTMTQLGYECRAALAPKEAYYSLMREPGSDEEGAALRQLEQKTPLCNVFFGEEQLSNWFQRTFVASGLYHWQQYRAGKPFTF